MIAGAVSVTVPVRDASGQVIAALSVGAPSMRMRPPRPRTLLPQVVEAAVRLSQSLGDRTPRPRLPANGPNGASSSAATQRWPGNGHGAAASGPHTIFR